MARHCVSCGTVNVDYAKFCGACGKSLQPGTGLPTQDNSTIQFQLGDDPQSWIDVAAELDRGGRHREALQCNERALELDPRSAAGWLGKALNLDGLARPQDAISALDRALELGLGNEAAWIAYTLKGRTLAKLGHYDEAILAFDCSLHVKEAHDVLMWKGRALRQLHRHEEALDCFNAVLDHNSDDLGALMDKAKLLVELNRYSEALPCLQAAQKLGGGEKASLGVALCLLKLSA